MALKMSKEYDITKWVNLKAILLRMGFNEWWVYLIMQFVSSVSYCITHARREIGPICPSRGIRQGDPLSPYLFILCVKGSQRCYEDINHKNGYIRVKACQQAPSITHMLFANDSYLYCKANEEESMRILNLIEIFEKALGEKVNLLKSLVFFSMHVNHTNR